MCILWSSLEAHRMKPSMLRQMQPWIPMKKQQELPLATMYVYTKKLVFAGLTLTVVTHSICYGWVCLIREFKITTMATATGTLLNKRFNEQNNGCARALIITLCTFLCCPLQNNNLKWPILHCLKNVKYSTTANFIKFFFKIIAVFQIQFCHSSDSDKQSLWLKSIPRFIGKI